MSKKGKRNESRVRISHHAQDRMRERNISFRDVQNGVATSIYGGQGSDNVMVTTFREPVLMPNPVRKPVTVDPTVRRIDLSATVDSDVVYKQCYGMFRVTVREKEYYKSKGFSEPKSCPSCRDRKKSKIVEGCVIVASRWQKRSEQLPSEQLWCLRFEDSFVLLSNSVVENSVYFLIIKNVSFCNPLSGNVSFCIPALKVGLENCNFLRVTTTPMNVPPMELSFFASIASIKRTSKGCNRIG